MNFGLNFRRCLSFAQFEDEDEEEEPIKLTFDKKQNVVVKIFIRSLDLFNIAGRFASDD